MVKKYKLKDGSERFFYQVYIRKDQRKIKKRGFLKEKDARTAELNFLYELRLSHGVYNDKDTMASFAEYYFNNKIKSHKAPSTVSRYEVFKDDVIEYLGMEKLKDITVMDIEDFYRQIKEDRSLSDNTILKLHRYLRMSLDTAVRNRMIVSNPADFVELPKNQKIEMKYWRAEDIKGNLEKLKDSFIYPIIFMAVNTGLRLGELLALTWDDVDLIRGEIKVNKSIYRLNGETLLKMNPKTKSGIRKVPLFSSALAYLKEYKMAQVPSIKRLVFHFNGEYWNPKNISKYFKEELQDNKVDVIRFHDLRHTYATMLLKSGVDDLIVSKTLGHSTVSFTKDIYGHVDEDQQRDEINKASKYF